ncbi:MAG: winged helix-turn-helix transcriptional regulator [Thermoleophilaceae bacterium]
MTGKRTYHDACGIARALDIVGERWAILVVRELLLGPKRFTDIRAGLPSLSSDVLAQRLRDLEASGVVTQRRLPPPAASKVYELTAMGAALEPALAALGRWGGANAPAPAEGAGMSVDAHILHLTTLFDPDLAGDFDFRLELVLGEQPFFTTVSAGRIEAGRGVAHAPDATLHTDAATFLGLVRGWHTFAETLAAGDIEIRGDEEAFQRFLGLFPLPAPAVAAA